MVSQTTIHTSNDQEGPHPPSERVTRQLASEVSRLSSLVNEVL